MDITPTHLLLGCNDAACFPDIGYQPLVAFCRHMVWYMLIIISSDNGFLPYDTKPLPEWMLCLKCTRSQQPHLLRSQPTHRNPCECMRDRIPFTDLYSNYRCICHMYHPLNVLEYFKLQWTVMDCFTALYIWSWCVLFKRHLLIRFWWFSQRHDYWY